MLKKIYLDYQATTPVSKEIVEKILSTILAEEYNQNKIIEVWNKSDLLNKKQYSYFYNLSKRKENVLLFSSKFRKGRENFIKLINKKLEKDKKFFLFNFSSSTNSKKIKSLL